ncbi:hypothetical protein Tco_1117878 [Tanacetum coccineum]
MSTLAEFMIFAGVDNHPPMLDKPQYASCKIRMEIYIQELSDKEKLQADCDLKATNIILQGLPLDVYALVNHHKIAKDIWDRVKLLMQGTSLSRKERECKLYDEFDKFSHVKAFHQNGAYANEARLMREIFPDPIALVANYDPQSSHSNNYHSQYTSPQYQQQLSPPI